MLGIYNILSEVKKLFFPIRCIACSALCDSEYSLCKKCEELYVAKEKFYRIPITNNVLVFAFDYDDELRKVIHKLKFFRRRDLALPIAKNIVRAIESLEIDKNFSMITYVPMNIIKLKKRGYNQSKLIAEHIAKKLNLQISDLGLLRLDSTAQHSMSGKDRRSGDTLSFEIDGNVRLNGHILLIDDVYTTGTTAQTVSTILKSAGAENVTIAVAARVKPRFIQGY